ncbi:MAG TPA: aconitate hydratase AcnA [Steroidobacteraceae bacterium]|nr:aconitate hydratase AcnA [Steroidobacteraceae bacterium]
MDNSFRARSTLKVGDQTYEIWSLAALPQEKLARLPYSLKVLLENLLRHEDGVNVTRADIEALLDWDPAASPAHEIAFTPARVILQDFTGVPCVVDLAAMRDAIVRLGGSAERVNPLNPAELVIDHSVQVDEYGTPHALAANTAIEFARNRERYAFLRWGQTAFRNLSVVPPSTGIVHQVNLEYLARVIFDARNNGTRRAYPDTLVGTDSHTTMINGLGVLGWGVGGIEAEAAMLGQPVTMLIPQVIGFRLEGRLQPGATATDLVLTVTEMLRKKGVVDKFVEFFGDGLANLPLADRATIANMAPEYGSTCGIFPIDTETVRYLELSGRSRERLELVSAYARAQGIWRNEGALPASYTDVLDLDLGTVEPSLAGPRRPQDRVPLRSAKQVYELNAKKAAEERSARGAGARGVATAKLNGGSYELKDGAVLIAAITSCTNTSNPSVMLGAGLLARKARARGLKSKPWVKTSLAPGSRVVTDYFAKAGLLEDLDALGFDLVGYGCTTCLAAGTPVLLANGTSRRIESLPAAGGLRLFGPTADRRLAMATQTEMMVQGERECISIVLQDGRRLVCTDDHRILCEDGRWVPAGKLVPGRDRVLTGLEAPLDDAGADEAGYELIAGSWRFGFANEQERARTLAFARLLGHLISDGSISRIGQGRMNVGQALDREAALDDIELLTGRRPVAKRYDPRKWTIVLPADLTALIASLPGVRTGRRIHQVPELPYFVLDDRCPVSMVREFLGALFGTDGHAPKLQRQGDGEASAVLSPPAYAQSAKPEHVEALKQVLRQMVQLLVRCGVKARGAQIYTYPVRRSASSYPPARDGAERIEVRLALAEGLSFVERVGFRYCVNKSLRASAAAVYWRTIDTINRQRLWMADRIEALRGNYDFTFQQTRRRAAAELMTRETALFPHYSLLEGADRFDRLLRAESERGFRPMHRTNCDFPAPAQLLKEIGARNWFARLQPRGSAAAGGPRYCTDKEALTLPTLSLQVRDVRPAGARRVFDLAVDDVHAFVAGTVSVHNCIGNSGPLKPEISAAVKEGDLTAAAVLSGNRNFEGRVHPETRMNFLASPPLVVAYALAGTLDIDLTREPLGTGNDGKPVYLADIWPSDAEIQELATRSIDSQMFRQSYASVFKGDQNWANISVPTGQLYIWDEKSTYVKNPPYFAGMTMQLKPLTDVRGARVLALLGDSVTTDHISPAGNISKNSPAARYLVEQGVSPADFNSYGARRGNHEVMMRGTFANIRLRNLMVPGVEGGVTLHLPEGERGSIYDIAMRYQREGTPLVVLAGREYGTGSSRDWAAKGTMLLGVKAVIAESFERIHRSNLIGMGVAPLQFLPGQGVAALQLSGREIIDITGLSGGDASEVTVTATPPDGPPRQFKVRVRIDTPKEREYYRHGGILQYVLRQLATAGGGA